MDKEKLARSLIIQYIESCAEADAENAEELNLSAQCLRNVWEITDAAAIPDVKSIIDLIPDPKYDTEKAVALKLEGNAALKSRDFDLAIAKYTEAISVDPTQSTFYCNRAAAYSNKGEHESAITDCEKAISLDPQYATAYSRLGYAYFQMKNIPEARKAYERGLRACPENQSLKENLQSLGPAPAAPESGAAPGADMFGGLFGGAGAGLFGEVSKRMASPEVQELLADPEMEQLKQEIQANPASLFSRMGDPKVQRIINAILPGGLGGLMGMMGGA